MPDFDAIKSIRNFKSLVKYLRTKLDWPIDEEDADDLTFDYSPDELGLAEEVAVKIREIKQVRPLVEGQPWGIFWIDFEPKRLPVVAMRRILSALVRKKRARRSSQQAVWDLNDLLFISATGESNQRGINFAHFRENADGQPQLRTFTWDANERHFYWLERINLENLRWPPDATKITAWRNRWASAFTAAHGEVIATAKDLASRMADLAASIRTLVLEVYRYEKPGGPLHKLYDSFKRVLISDLSEDDFADMYAQTVTYGLFSARVTNTGKFALENVVSLVPNTNPFLRDLLEDCLTLGVSGKSQIDLDELGVGELVEVLASPDTNIEAVLHDFGKLSRDHKEDPVIHFYESFLHEYDARKKAQRGVFYTPDPVVSFIVRSVDYLLRTEFDCPDGLADTGTMTWKGKTVPKVQVLDPATGTGTFLKYTIEQIYETFTRKCVKQGMSTTQIRKAWNAYVPKHLLPRLYGFELMMAPYAVAHMKLGLALRETEYNFASDERLRVYLTNALQPAHEIPRTDSLSLAHEAEEANKVKTDVPVTVVIGNPPYSGHSANASKNADGTLNFIGTLLNDYYKVDGKPLGERNPKWLQDDYVKFIRFGQWRIDETGEGILAFITNHGYLDNPTFRGMRQQLMHKFSDIYVYDLHGNLMKRETDLDGSKDENVFDIQPGVAICLMVQRRGAHGTVKIHHAHLYGLRKHKYEVLLSAELKEISWTQIVPSAPFYIFAPQDINLRAEYQRGWKITEILPVNSVGVITGQDRETIGFTREEANQLAQAHRLSENKVLPVLYRTFDIRFMIYDSSVVTRPRLDVMQHMLATENFGIVCTRQQSVQGPWGLIGVANHVIEGCYLSNKTAEINYLFPTYLSRRANNSSVQYLRTLLTLRAIVTQTLHLNS